MGVSHVSNRARAAVVLTGLLAAAGCGEVARTGRSPGYLIIERLEGASGATPTAFSTVVSSDVQTIVKRTVGEQELQVPTVFGDPGRAQFSIGLKNPGSATSPTEPSAMNAITLTRYRVVFRRADGRNTQGVDVPYAFDGGMTLTVPAGATATGVFDLVRVIAKMEPPLLNLVAAGGVQAVATIAEVTFYGQDQAGNEVSATGTISVTFADFGDPA